MQNRMMGKRGHVGGPSPAPWLAVVVSLAVAACGDGDLLDSASSRGVSADGPAGLPGLPAPGTVATPTTGVPLAPPGVTTPGATPRPMLPPEVEMELSLERPQGSERYVYATNPSGGNVVIIHGESRGIQLVETGRQPTFLRTLAGSDDAIVLNIGDDDATVIRGPENPGDTPETYNLPVVDGANTIEVAPDGRHAVVLHDAERGTGEGGFGDFQAVTVLSLAGDTGTAAQAFDMTVGFKPRAVTFKGDSSEAYVVTEAGVSVLNFAQIEAGGEGIAETINFETGNATDARDVSITPDGRYAVARRPGRTELTLVDLNSGSTRSLDLADVYAPPAGTTSDPALDAGVAGVADAGTPDPDTFDVSDLDVAADGRHAVAVLRNRGAVMRIDIPAGFEDPGLIETRHVEDIVVGQASLVPDSDRVLLYTTAVASERLAIVDFGSSDDPNIVDLRKLVQAVVVTDDGSTAIIVHRATAGDPEEPGIDFEERLDRSQGYSLLRPETGFTRLTSTPVPPGPLLMVPSGDFLFITFRGDLRGVRSVHRIGVETFLVADEIPLGSPPVGIGVVPASKQVFVSQQHPDGRITFIQWETAEKFQVTGFELNSRIRD